MVGPPCPRQLSAATEMNFDDFCRRARINATVSKHAHYVTGSHGIYQVTSEPKYTEQILYTAYPQRPFPFQPHQS